MDEETVLHRCPGRAETRGLSSTETFLFSQIDGATPLTELANLTGIPLEKVISIAGRLAALGVVGEGRPESSVQRAAPVIPPPMAGGDLLQVPHRTTRDIYGLKLDPGDAFFLSNVDDRLSIEELADIIGFDPAKALRSVEVLVKAGAVELGPAAPRAPPMSNRRPPGAEASGSRAGRGGQKSLSRAPAARRATVPPIETPRQGLGIATPPVDRAEGDVCDLDAETLAKIDAALVGVAARTHYGILGLPRRASSKEIRRAYFALAGTLHPDRYFRKKLGPYKKKLAAAFEKATASYELLRVESTRAEYDAQLKLTGEPEEITIAFAPLSPSPENPASSASKRKSLRPTKSPKSLRPTKGPKGRASAPKMPTIPPTSTPVITQALSPSPSKTRSVRPSKAPQARTSAAKIPAIPRAAPEPRPAPSPPASAAAAPPAKGKVETPSKSAPLLASAQKALIQGDGAAAANLYRLALQFAEDAAARRYAESGLKEARSLLADGYAKTARSEEKASNWSAAVAAYGKAVDLRPQDDALCERLANALREEGVDLARATRIAELAISRAPRRASYQKTLGRILMQAGQRKQALEQLERAFAIEPDEATSQLIARLRKQGRG